MTKANVDEALSQLQLSMPEEAQVKAMAYLEQLKKWNRAYNLTAIKSLSQMITHHLLDSLAIAPFVRGERVIDVGTGAGLPGIPLALYFPEKQFTLLDSCGKKTRFLTQIKSDLKIHNIEIVSDRFENYHPAESFDVIIFRAVKSIPEMIQKTKHLLSETGQYLAMKATHPAAELNDLSYPYTEEMLSIPGMNAERRLIIIEGKKNG